MTPANWRKLRRFIEGQQRRICEVEGCELCLGRKQMRTEILQELDHIERASRRPRRRTRG